MNWLLKSYIKFLFSVIYIIIVHSGCQPNEPKIHFDVSYGPFENNKLDLLYPSYYDENTPIIITIHPGAWMSGDKSILNKLVNNLHNSQYIIANINHRYVSDSINLSDLELDLDRVCHFVDSILGGNSRNPTFLLGTSSGGHLALYYGQLNKSLLQFKGIIAFAAPNNLLDKEWQQVIDSSDIKKATEWMVGSPYHDTSEKGIQKFINSSPFFQKHPLPIYLFHGDEDPVVPISLAEKFYDKLLLENDHHKLFVLKGFKHEIGTRDSVLFSNITQSINEWIQENK